MNYWNSADLRLSKKYASFVSKRKKKYASLFFKLKTNINENFRKKHQRSGGGGPFCEVRWLSHFSIIISKKNLFQFMMYVHSSQTTYLVKIYF